MVGNEDRCPRGAVGQPGENGILPAVQVPVALPGKDGSTSTELIHDTSVVAVAPPVSWLCQFLHAAETDFVNNRRDSCATKLNWLARLLTLTVGASKAGNQNVGFAYEKLRSLSDSLLSGLDAFGRDQNYVSLLKYEFMENEVTVLIGLSRDIEKAATALSGKEKVQEGDKANVEKGMASANQTILSARQQINVEFEKISQLKIEIAELRVQLDACYLQLQSASDEFRKAVENRAGGGCDLSNVLRFVSMVATVVTTAGAASAAWIAASSAWGNVQKLSRQPSASDSWFDNLVADTKELSSVVRPAGEKLSEFKTSYASAKAEVEEAFKGKAPAPNASPLGTDYAKLYADKTSFDKEIEPFMTMPQAQEYKKLMDSFVSTSETRNNRILDHDATVKKIYEGWANIQSARAESAALNAGFQYDFELSDQAAFLKRSLARVKWSAMRSIANMVKALEYVSGEAITDIVYNDSSVASTEDVLAQVKQKHVSVMEMFGQASGQAKNLTIPLREVLTTEASKRILEGGTATFSIRPDIHDVFDGRFAVMVTQVRLAHLPAGVGAMKVTFEHQGRSVMRARDTSLRTYSHSQVSAIFERNHFGDPVSAGELHMQADPYVGVSPYGPWKLQILASAADRKKALDGALAFDVECRTLPLRADNV